MNCEYLRENLYEHLDGSLSASDRAAAERHIAGCPACREAVRRESQVARSLSAGFEQTVAAVELGSAGQRRIAGAVGRNVANVEEQSLILFWRRLIFPFAAMASGLIVLFWVGRHFAGERNPHLEARRASTLGGNREMQIHYSYSVPEYTFRKDGNRVVDALTSETVVVDESFAEKNEQPRTGEINYEN